jgi:replicative DNA helicase
LKKEVTATVDQILFRKALREEGALWKLEQIGIKRQYLLKDVQRAWVFVEDFLRKNQELPSDEVICFQMDWDDTPLEEFPVTLQFAAEVVRHRTVEQKLNATVDAVQRELAKGTDHVFEAQRVLLEMADDIRGLGEDGLTATNLFDLYPEVLVNYDQYKAGDIGITTPWETMTVHTLGFQMGQCVFFCARPQTGKTWALLMNCLHVHELGYRVLLVTPELTEVEAAERAACMQTGTSYSRFTRGELDEWSERRMRDAIDEFKGRKGFWVADSTMQFNKKEVEALIAQYDPDVIAVDSVYCFGDGRNRNDKIQNVVPWLIQTARNQGRLRLVLATSQMNRSATTPETTTMENIYGSDAIGQDSHLVYGLFQSEEMYRDNQMGMTQIKVRRGTRHDPFYCHWDLDEMKFGEIGKTGYERDEDKTNEEKELDDDIEY